MRAVLFCAVLMCGCSGKPEGDKPPKDGTDQTVNPVAKLTFAELRKEYAHPIQADVKYKGKFIELTGPVWEIDSDAIGFGAMPTDRATIICKIDPAHKAEFTTVKEGKSFTLIGRVAGSHVDEITARIITLDMCRAVK